MTRIEELRIATRKCHDGPTALRLNRELNALLESDLARKDAALREADEAIHDLIEAQPYPRGRGGALEELRTRIRSALTPARET